MLADVRELAPLRHPAQEPRAGPAAGCCKGKSAPPRVPRLRRALRPGLRKWSGTILADHRADRRTWLTETLGLPATDPDRYAWELVAPGDCDHMPAPQRLLHAVAYRMRWLWALDQARRRAVG